MFTPNVFTNNELRAKNLIFAKSRKLTLYVPNRELITLQHRLTQLLNKFQQFV